MHDYGECVDARALSKLGGCASSLRQALGSTVVLPYVTRGFLMLEMRGVAMEGFFFIFLLCQDGYHGFLSPSEKMQCWKKNAQTPPRCPWQLATRLLLLQAQYLVRKGQHHLMFSHLYSPIELGPEESSDLGSSNQENHRIWDPRNPGSHTTCKFEKQCISAASK